MSKSSTLWTIIIIAILIAIGWYYFSNQNNFNISTQTSTNQADIASSTDTSDASLNQDLKSVDSQLNGLNTDTSNVDQSLQ